VLPGSVRLSWAEQAAFRVAVCALSIVLLEITRSSQASHRPKDAFNKANTKPSTVRALRAEVTCNVRRIQGVLSTIAGCERALTERKAAGTIVGSNNRSVHDKSPKMAAKTVARISANKRKRLGSLAAVVRPVAVARPGGASASVMKASPAQRTAVKQRPHQETERHQVATSEPVVHHHGRQVGRCR
jgi:hypothetical protein